MTSAQMLRHLRRHPHRVEVARMLLMIADEHRGACWYPRFWTRELRTIAMEIVR